MGWSFTVGRVAGTDIKLHATFLLLLAFQAWAAFARGGAGEAVAVTVFVLALFVCILLHEFGHILAARRYGVRTPDVLLLPIGGVARLERLPDEPRQELVIALGGPLVTLAIVLALFGWLALAGRPPRLTVASLFDQEGLAIDLLRTNLFLLAFNLIPAFPMDGGRVLRSLLATRLGLPRATRIAAGIGQTLAVAGGLWALANGHVLAALVALFVYLGAASEAAAVRSRAVSRGLRVAQAMVTDFRALRVHTPLEQAVALLLAGEQREFPVLDNDGRIEGLLTRDNLIAGLARVGPGGIVAQAMTAAPPVIPLSAEFERALETLRGSGLPALPVQDATGALVGLLTLDNIRDLLLVRQARGEA